MTQAITNISKSSVTETSTSRPWRRAMLWLMFLGPFFFLSYGLSNWLAAHNPDVNHMVFDWEYSIPFVPWTIIPYWSIDILYVLSFFVCSNQFELKKHALRLLTAQVIAVTCFILFPLGFSFTRPETTGLIGLFFTTLSQFDQPYNQAPSLHITLLVILWSLYTQHIPKKLVGLFHFWCLLIGVSVLTTYQHHFFDIPTGLLLGWFCVWLWPIDKKNQLRFQFNIKNSKHWKIAISYLIASIALLSAALYFQGIVFWLSWPAVSLFFVSLNYLIFDVSGFQKGINGHQSTAVKWLLFPYTLGAFINSRLWTRKSPKSVEVSQGIYIGRFPSAMTLKQGSFDLVIDMTAEFNKPHSTINWYSLPSLDLVIPSKEDLLTASELISKNQSKKILVCCALGYSRSALAILTWLLQSNPELSVSNAIEQFGAIRPEIVINSQAIKVLKTIASDRPASND
ncbi:MAG: phosphatase PAP2/dual specificity phosphatase family protein [Gammaproteobacteria bacterium]|nr:phosphatase PAP2/dual specificity phosphatase family protein [Gammaproteobacteria bacterium]